MVEGLLHREKTELSRCGGRCPTSPPRPLRNSQTVAYLKDSLTLMNFWSSFAINNLPFPNRGGLISHFNPLHREIQIEECLLFWDLLV